MTKLRFTPQGGSGLGCAQRAQNCGYLLHDDITFDPAAEPEVVPEPSTDLLMLTALAALAVALARRQHVKLAGLRDTTPGTEFSVPGVSLSRRIVSCG